MAAGTARWTCVLATAASLGLAACGEPQESETGAPCDALVDAADALEIVRSSGGELEDTEVNYATAAEAFEGTDSPEDLTDEWDTAIEGLRHFEQSVIADEVPRRSESEKRDFHTAFGRITQYAIEECDSGWRMLLDGCRDGEPPAGADEDRLILPCFR